jgi:hypothetical protein
MATPGNRCGSVQSRPQIESGPAALVAQSLELRRVRPWSLAECDFLVAIVSMTRSRWLPQKSFPAYAYLPGRNPHPVRDPTGHSYHVGPLPVVTVASLGSDAFLWVAMCTAFGDVGSERTRFSYNCDRTEARGFLLVRRPGTPKSCRCFSSPQHGDTILKEFPRG